MQFIKPSFYDQFHCTGSKCSDTCCAVWEIDIDPDTVDFYDALDGDFGERLRDNMEEAEDGSVCFRLDEAQRCPFLNEENLCEIILELGEDGLCEICREHPRFYDEFEDRLEMGVGLCCEEACRLLFEQKEPLTFVTTNIGKLPRSRDMSPAARAFRLRTAAFQIVQDRTLPLRVRVHRLLDFGEKTQREFFGATPAMLEKGDGDARETLFELLQSMELYDEAWPKYVQALDEEVPAANLDDLDGGYENLLVYFLYRHFVRGIAERNFAARVNFCVVSVWLICLMNTKCLVDTGAFTPWDRITCTKDYSKQVEYSEENIALLLSALHKNPSLSTEKLKSLF